MKSDNFSIPWLGFLLFMGAVISSAVIVTILAIVVRRVL